MIDLQNIQASAHAALDQIQSTRQPIAAQAPFSGMFRSMMEQASGVEAQANQTVMGLMNGSGVELHEAMIATQKADISFELALQVRNKAVAAYQQMMTMQF